jgi:hypothetical protein
MKPGDLVRHSKGTEWGVGVVVSVAADRVTINFEGRGRVVLSLSAAGPLLSPAVPGDLAPDSPLLEPDRWHEFELRPERRLQGTQRALCARCSKPLNRGPHSRDRRLKACPMCSANDGREHLFYESPSAFGQSDARETDVTPEGTQSYCYACRTGTDQGHAPIRCSEVAQ